MEDRIIITREKPEIERLLAEGHEHIATRNGVEYVFRLKAEYEIIPSPSPSVILNAAKDLDSLALPQNDKSGSKKRR